MIATVPALRPLQGRRVLVVEDQFLIADEMDRIIVELGGQVLGPAPTLGVARMLFDQDTPDIALLDINLRGEQVWDVAQELRTRGVPLIFATGYDAALLRPPFEAAIQIDKPVTAKDLAEAVSKLGLKPS